jgi:hypothetical protein
MIGVCKAESALFYQVFGSQGEATGTGTSAGPSSGGTTPAPPASHSHPPGGPTPAAGQQTPQLHWLDSAQQALSNMLESLCGLLSDLLRPLVLTIHDIDTLCELVHILSTEILSETIKRAGE